MDTAVGFDIVRLADTCIFGVAQKMPKYVFLLLAKLLAIFDIFDNTYSGYHNVDHVTS